MSEEQLRQAGEIMEARGIPPDDWIIYGLKHGLLPSTFTGSLADRYEYGCPNCRDKALRAIGEEPPA